jgi:hypothetical protein
MIFLIVDPENPSSVKHSILTELINQKIFEPLSPPYLFERLFNTIRAGETVWTWAKANEIISRNWSKLFYVVLVRRGIIPRLGPVSAAEFSLGTAGARNAAGGRSGLEPAASALDAASG